LRVASSRSAPRVLVVESRTELREAFKESLSATFLVSTARSAEGALGGLATYRPRAVLICEEQPGEIDGLNLASQLRGSPLGQDCLLIVYGGSRVAPESAKEDYGVDEYLGTKVTLKQLDELLCKHLRMGWTPMESSVSDEGDSGRFRHPMADEKMVSARSSEDEAPKRGFFRRLFGS